MTQFLRPTLSAVLVILCASCQDDPLLVEKREKQKAEIVRLKGELALIEEKLKNLPPDVTDQLTEAKALSEKQSAEVAVLESEVTALEARKRSLQNEFEAYQLKYQVK
jgi:DNA repair exonuclease SbcCD ATPase subunit